MLAQIQLAKIRRWTRLGSAFDLNESRVSLLEVRPVFTGPTVRKNRTFKSVYYSYVCVNFRTANIDYAT